MKPKKSVRTETPGSYNFILPYQAASIFSFFVLTTKRINKAGQPSQSLEETHNEKNNLLLDVSAGSL
jgi:hypothetical protein